MSDRELGTPTEVGIGKIAVIGANSSIGRRIVETAGSDVIAIARSRANIPPCAASIIISDYSEIPPDTFADCIAIINCVGSARGHLESLTRINVDVARNAALTAAQNSVFRFVQISSFSVFGDAELINKDTGELPVDAYGATKLLADRAVLSSGVREVAILRLPAIVGEGISSKLERLLVFWQRVHVMPVSRKSKRSMISVDAASEAALKLARAKGPISGIFKVADPRPVCLYELASNDPNFRRRRLWSVILPDAIVTLLRRFFPNPFDRIFGTSILTEEANSFHFLEITNRLEKEIERIMKNDL